MISFLKPALIGSFAGVVVYKGRGNFAKRSLFTLAGYLPLPWETYCANIKKEQITSKQNKSVN